MSNFKTFKKEMQNHITSMLAGQDRIFVTDVLETKKAEKKARANASTIKAEKQRLLAIKERKLNEADEGMSIEELDKKLAELG